MIDTRTNRPIQVSTPGPGLSYLKVPVDQLGRVRASLDGGDVDYWVDNITISIDGRPPVIFINLGRSCDPARVQAILDEAG